MLRTSALDTSGCAQVFLEYDVLLSMDDGRAYRARACGGEASLREQVESLLNASERAGSFLEQPAAARCPFYRATLSSSARSIAAP